MNVYYRKRVNIASKEPVGQTLSIYGSGLYYSSRSAYNVCRLVAVTLADTSSCVEPIASLLFTISLFIILFSNYYVRYTTLNSCLVFIKNYFFQTMKKPKIFFTPIVRTLVLIYSAVLVKVYL